MSLNIDFETRSQVDLRKTGVYPYAASETTDIWCMAFAFDDEEPELWVPRKWHRIYTPWLKEQGLSWGEYETENSGLRLTRICDYIADGGQLNAWNAQFERVIWNEIMGPEYNWPVPKLEQWHDTAADAAAMSLPRGLGNAAMVLGLEEQKDEGAGHRLMMQMCKPRSVKRGEVVWWDQDPEKFKRLCQYCMQDVRTERAVGERLRPLSTYEQDVYFLDQKVNDRGVAIDVPLIEASQKIVAIGMEKANEELRELTNGSVGGVTKVADLTRWLQEAGTGIEDVRKDTLRDLLGEDTLSPEVRRVVTLRAESAKSSTAKLVSMLHYRCADDRVRGLLLYHGAGTGRWSGRGPQPQNYPRPTVRRVERFVSLVQAGAYDLINMEEPPLVVISSLLRSMLVAGGAHRLMSADYQQIEARVLAWIAGQDDLVEAFATGQKIYETMAAHIYGVPVGEIVNPSERRQVGKNTILGCGFGMGAKTYVDQIKTQTGLVIITKLGEKAVNTYRSLYPMVPKFWVDINRAAMNAVLNPGTTTVCGRNNAIRYTFRGQFLWCVLPSGRVLAYGMPRIEMRTTHTVKVDPETGEEYTDTWTRKTLSYWAVNSKTRKWTKHYAYGGLLTENVVQAMARDLMADAMLRVDAAGYPVILTVHDEVVADVPDGHGSLQEFLDLMQISPPWAEGLPVAVDGWEGPRYRK